MPRSTSGPFVQLSSCPGEGEWKLHWWDEQRGTQAALPASSLAPDTLELLGPHFGGSPFSLHWGAAQHRAGGGRLNTAHSSKLAESQPEHKLLCILFNLKNKQKSVINMHTDIWSWIQINVGLTTCVCLVKVLESFPFSYLFSAFPLAPPWSCHFKGEISGQLLYNKRKCCLRQVFTSL